MKISNINLLYQHLNGESRNQQFEKLDYHLQQVANLYNGKLIAASDDSFILLFNGQSDDCIKHALYSGELILKLNQQTEKSIIIMNGFIQTTHTKPIASAAINMVRKGLSDNKHQLFIDKTLLANSKLEEQLNLEEVEKSPNVMWVKGFNGSNGNFLENQLELLRRETE